nr:MAG TPA: SGNH hydrolase [Caudoviricetes sp.]
MTKLIALGDSIMWGVTGFDSQHPRANPTIPDHIGTLLGWTVDNQAISSTRWADVDNKDNFLEQVAKFNFANYDVVLMGYGINDFDDAPYSSPTQITYAMNKGITKIKSDNPNIHLYIELPTPSFVHGSTDGAVNPAGYNQKQIYDTIKSEAQLLEVPAYDWRDNPLITYDNRAQTLGDGQIHPVNAVQQEMAERLANWIKSLEQSTASTAGNGLIDWSSLGQGQTASSGSTTQTVTYTPIKVATINGPDDLIQAFNGNTVLIINTICKIAGEDASAVSWHAQTFDKLGRKLRNYISDTIATIKQVSSQTLGTTNTETSNGETVSVEAMEAPTSLMIGDVIATLNDDFKGAETALNAILATL